jgi:uncharacterized protein
MITYHLRRIDRAITDHKELEAIITSGKYAVLALSKNDIPYIVTLSYGFDAESNALYFHCANSGRKIDYVRFNPNVSATIIEDRGYIDGKCEHHFSTLVIAGKIFEVKTPDEKEIGLKTILNHLETMSQEIFSKKIPNKDALNDVTILKLEIENIHGKKWK